MRFCLSSESRDSPAGLPPSPLSISWGSSKWCISLYSVELFEYPWEVYNPYKLYPLKFFVGALFKAIDHLFKSGIKGLMGVPREGGSAGRAEVAVAFRGAAAERAALQPYLAALSAADDQAPPPEKTIDA